MATPTVPTCQMFGIAVLLLVQTACEPAAPRPSTSEVTPCCGTRGSCLPTALIDSNDAQLLDGAECIDGSLCVPEGLQRNEPLKRCRVESTEAEGRCVPDCLPQVVANREQLARDDCDEGDRCVPCYDPLSGEFTGACGLATDSGPNEPPTVFESCCDDDGRCVPSSLVVSEERARFGPDICDDEQALCVPRKILRAGQSFQPSTCTIAAVGAEGRCLPACLPQVARDVPRLTRETCEENELCTPCFDPIDGTSTGACELASDPGPRKPAARLAECCGDLGRCVPQDLVDESVRSRLGVDSCTGAGFVCAPEPFVADPTFTPPSCTVAELGLEGRCLLVCLPDIAAQKERLSQGECAAGHVCAPCVDPFTGVATGSCSFGNDKGPTGPAKVFGQCCAGDGRCVPSAALPTNQREQLGRDSCASEDQLCAPAAFIDSPQAAPATCEVSSIGAEGRCLLDCLPPVAARSSVLTMDGCPDRHSCVPCFDPLSGAETGACSTIEGDLPVLPPVELARCCDGRGRCTPSAWVPREFAGLFDQETCEASEFDCVAPEAALDADFEAVVCRDDVLGAEGRCAPTCLAAVQMRASQLRRATCSEAELCVPCFDPLSGEATGACNGPNDPGPREPPVVFADCCASSDVPLGTCVPTDLLPFEIDGLQRETCPSADAVCVPTTIAKDSSAELPACNSALSGRGICMEACFLGSQGALLTRSTCASTERCVPCSVLGAPIAGC